MEYEYIELKLNESFQRSLNISASKDIKENHYLLRFIDLLDVDEENIYIFVNLPFVFRILHPVAIHASGFDLLLNRYHLVETIREFVYISRDESSYLAFYYITDSEDLTYWKLWNRISTLVRLLPNFLNDQYTILRNLLEIGKIFGFQYAVNKVIEIEYYPNDFWIYIRDRYLEYKEVTGLEIFSNNSFFMRQKYRIFEIELYKICFVFSPYTEFPKDHVYYTRTIYQIITQLRSKERDEPIDWDSIFLYESLALIVFKGFELVSSKPTFPARKIRLQVKPLKNVCTTATLVKIIQRIPFLKDIFIEIDITDDFRTYLFFEKKPDLTLIKELTNSIQHVSTQPSKFIQNSLNTIVNNYRLSGFVLLKKGELVYDQRVQNLTTEEFHKIIEMIIHSRVKSTKSAKKSEQIKIYLQYGFYPYYFLVFLNDHLDNLQSEFIKKICLIFARQVISDFRNFIRYLFFFQPVEYVVVFKGGKFLFDFPNDHLRMNKRRNALFDLVINERYYAEKKFFEFTYKLSSLSLMYIFSEEIQELNWFINEQELMMNMESYMLDHIQSHHNLLAIFAKRGSTVIDFNCEKINIRENLFPGLTHDTSFLEFQELMPFASIKEIKDFYFSNASALFIISVGPYLFVGIWLYDFKVKQKDILENHFLDYIQRNDVASVNKLVKEYDFDDHFLFYEDKLTLSSSDDLLERFGDNSQFLQCLFRPFLDGRFGSYSMRTLKVKTFLCILFFRGFCDDKVFNVIKEAVKKALKCDSMNLAKSFEKNYSTIFRGQLRGLSLVKNNKLLYNFFSEKDQILTSELIHNNLSGFYFDPIEMGITELEMKNWSTHYYEMSTLADIAGDPGLGGKNYVLFRFHVEWFLVISSDIFPPDKLVMIENLIKNCCYVTRFEDFSFKFLPRDIIGVIYKLAEDHIASSFSSYFIGEIRDLENTMRNAKNRLTYQLKKYYTGLLLDFFYWEVYYMAGEKLAAQDEVELCGIILEIFFSFDSQNIYDFQSYFQSIFQCKFSNVFSIVISFDKHILAVWKDETMIRIDNEPLLNQFKSIMFYSRVIDDIRVNEAEDGIDYTLLGVENFISLKSKLFELSKKYKCTVIDRYLVIIEEEHYKTAIKCVQANFIEAKFNLCQIQLNCKCEMYIFDGTDTIYESNQVLSWDEKLVLHYTFCYDRETSKHALRVFKCGYHQEYFAVISYRTSLLEKLQIFALSLTLNEMKHHSGFNYADLDNFPNLIGLYELVDDKLILISRKNDFLLYNEKKMVKKINNYMVSSRMNNLGLSDFRNLEKSLFFNPVKLKQLTSSCCKAKNVDPKLKTYENFLSGHIGWKLSVLLKWHVTQSDLKKLNRYFQNIVANSKFTNKYDLSSSIRTSDIPLPEGFEALVLNNIPRKYYLIIKMPHVSSKRLYTFYDIRKKDPNARIELIKI